MSDKGSNIKSRLPSRHVSVGPKSAPHRSMYYAMGMTEEQIYQPFVGVATTWNESAPCNITLGRQAQAVKKGVKEVNGTPREFTTITVTDGIAMGHEAMKASLVSREVIADSVELSVRGHCYDGIVGLAGCDKSLPGLMMAMELDSFDRVQKVIYYCLNHGLIVDWFLFNTESVRIAPPLIISKKEIETACAIILDALENAKN